MAPSTPPEQGVSPLFVRERALPPFPVWLLITVLVLPWLVVAAAAQGPSVAGARVWLGTLELPTHEEGPPDPNPPFDLFEPTRVNYPYTMRTTLTDRRATRAWRAVYLENEYLKCSVLPDLGGHLYSCTDKVNGAELFYANPSIKLARIAYRGAWTALGIEFNFPVSHNWMTASPVDFALAGAPDGSASVVVGNTDRVYGMQWRVALTLRPGRAVLEQRTTLYNRSDVRHRFYWWTNAGVEVWDDSRILYPMAFTAAHGFADIDTWPVTLKGVDLSVLRNQVFGPVSRFAHGSREEFMAVYHPRTRAGVAHYSPRFDLPAKKIWSWGVDADAMDWRRALSDNESAYVEIQAGLFRDQETYGFLEPQESVSFTEYWLPLRETGGLVRANPDAAVNLTREPSAYGRITLVAALNVTRAIRGATVELARAGTVLQTLRPGPLTPAAVFSHRFTGLSAEDAYTLTVRDGAGHPVITHTEGQYEFTPAGEIRLGPQPPHKPAAATTEGDYLVLGDDQERDGKRLGALATYREGLQRYPTSLSLRRAAGRLAVGLRQYAVAIADLEPVMARVSNDYEAAYYLGRAHAGSGDLVKARRAWEVSQAYGPWRTASLLGLASLAARAGALDEALATLARVEGPDQTRTRAGGMEVALLRRLGRVADARDRLTRWRAVDPTSSLLRYEAVRLGAPDDALFAHLAGDPERILELVVDYLRVGLDADALDLLTRDYPKGPAVVTEPGMSHPSAYPLLAYYRGHVRERLGQDGRADYAAAAKMSVRYVFPNRPEDAVVLARALAAQPSDANAHFLSGALALAGGLPAEARASFEMARRLDPAIPALHWSLGTLLAKLGAPPDQVADVFTEGLKHDPRNVGLYGALDDALARAGRPPADRVRALAAYPDQQALPATLAVRLAEALAADGRFDDAERQFRGRFFAREEGGLNVRQTWIGVRVRRASALAEQGQCAEARDIVGALASPVPDLAFTRDGLEPFVNAAPAQRLIAGIRERCPVGR